ncbi:TolC family protein [uncultured Bacteroides sp.]|uniref:TolC family protein n=1 Tax=uncultured Bacteroides sp. TaxID=162156 RepID=UPI002AAAC1EA|nr:TolC family protein [uncultured Bacteroides sp.]
MKTTIKKHIVTCALIYMACLQGNAQTSVQPLTYSQYMEKVNAGNLEYAAEKLNVSISEAEAIAAKVRNDPQLGFSYFNNEQAKKKMGYGGSVSISQTVTFGKRTAAVELARSENSLTIALLADYLRNLRADATVAYMEALKQDQLYKVKQNAYQNIFELAKSDSIRLSKGKIMEIDAIQSKLEAGIMYNELLQSESEMKNALTSLSVYTGTKDASLLFHPDASLHIARRSFDLPDLIRQGTVSRSDITAAMQNVEVANRALKVACRERNMDVDVSLEVSHNAQVKNEDAPAPAYSGVTAGIAIPLQFSRLNKGAILAAKHRTEQASIQYDQAVLQVQNEILKAYHQYESLTKQVEHYENGMLEQANQVLKGKIYSYSRGEVSLLEVLNAQRTYDDVQALYYETLFNYASAMVELEKSAGAWDIKL